MTTGFLDSLNVTRVLFLCVRMEGVFFLFLFTTGCKIDEKV